MMTTPLQIVMTPVRNEAWILPAFLRATSLWADYIIIADQMSTDGSRELYQQFDKVIVIDNTNPNFNEAERQSMLVAKAREVAAGRDTLLWGLDADEILPANWMDTNDGQHILNSVKGDVFWFKWAQLAPDREHYGDAQFNPWLFHDDGKEPHGNYVRNMHSMRIPYPIEEKQMYYVKDFRVLHCSTLDPQRIAAKNRFYQFVDWELNHRSPIVLSRTYAAHRIENQSNETAFELTPESTAFPFDFWNTIQIGAKHTWFDDYIYERLSHYQEKQLRKLDIWDREFVSYYNLKDERNIWEKILHKYLHVSQKYSNSLLIRVVDRFLKKIV
jgi:hypothetical protein